MWSVWQSRKMGRRVAGLLGGLLATILLVAAPAAAALFEKPVNVSNSASVPSELPAIAVNGAGRVFVAWKEGAEIFFTRTQGSCGGLKFEAPVSLWAGTVAPSGPALAANDTGVFVAWQASGSVWFRRSTDGEGTFVPNPPLNLGPNIDTKNIPSVAADNTGVFVAWSNGSPGEIFFARSMNSGVGFDGPAANVSGTPLNSRAPSVTTDGSNVFLAWEDGNFPFLSIRYKKFGRSAILTDVAGLATTNLSNGLGFAFSPNLAFGDRILSVVFGTFNGPSFYHRSSSDGTTFSAPQDVSGTMSRLSPSDARAARRNGSAMVAWAQRLGLTDADTEIQYWLGGLTIEQGSVSPTPGAKSVSPAAAIDSTGRLLVAWQETVNLNGVLNDEIYVSYSGGTGGGSEMKAEVWSAPRHVNPQTMGPGTMRRPNLTVFIEPSEGQNWSVYDIYPGSVRLNGKEALGPTAIGDSNGNGKPDMMVKFDRGDLGKVAPGDLEYPVTGDTKLPDGSRGCPFRGNGKVQIMP